jgi:hypothetical protein
VAEEIGPAGEAFEQFCEEADDGPMGFFEATTWSWEKKCSS